MSQRWPAIGLLLISLLGLALRLFQLGTDSLGGDEPLSVVFYSRPLDRLFPTLVYEDLHPPLYPLLLHGWMRLFGNGEFAVRLPSAIFGALLVPATYLAARSFWGRRREATLTGLLAAALTALSPIQLAHSQEARNYVLVTLLTVLSGAALFMALRSGQRRDWALYSLATLAAIFTHYNAFLVVGVQVLFMLLIGRRFEGRLRSWALALGAALLLFAPWAAFMVRQLLRISDFIPTVFSVGAATRDLLAALIEAGVGRQLGPVFLPAVGLGLALVALGVLSVLRMARGEGRSATIYLLLALVMPLAAMLVVWTLVPKFSARYVIVVVPPLLLLVARGLVFLLTLPVPGSAGAPGAQERDRRWQPGQIAARGGRALGAVLALVALGWSVIGVQGTYASARQDYRGVVAYISQQAGPNDAILHVWAADHPFQYYYHGPLPVYTYHFPEDFAGAAAELNRITAGRDRLWVVYSFEDFPDPSRFLRHSLEERALEPPVERQFAGGLRVVGYRLDPSRPFTAEPVIGHPANVRFANGVTFLGWDVVRGPARAGAPAQLDLHWRAEQPVPADFKVVVVVEDAAGQPLARLDRTPIVPLYPPTRWRPGLVLHGPLGFELPAETPPAEYRLRLAIYDEATQREIELLGPDGRPAGTRAEIGRLPLERAEQPPRPEAVAIGHRFAPALGFGGPEDAAPQLLGYDLAPGEPLEGDWVTLSLFWHAPVRPSGDATVVLQGLADDGRVVLETSFAPVDELPTGRWNAGDLFVGRHRLRLPVEVPGGRLRLRLGLRDGAGRALTPAGAPAGTLADLGELAVRERQIVREPPPMEHAVGADFGGQIRLLGYDLDLADARPGGTLKLTLYWQARAPIDRSYKVFNHLVDGSDRFVGQRDSEPVDGTLKTLVWKPGEVVADHHDVPIRPDAAPGDYLLKVGLYDPRSGARLPLADGATFVLLATVSVRSQP